MPTAPREPQRFREMARRARRNRSASAVAVAVLKADSRVAQTIERALAEAGLTLPQFNILMELAAVDGGALPLYELNRRLISTPPNTSWLSAKMETAGLVTKTRDSRDSRVVIMAITDQGWQMLEHAAPLVFAAEQRLLAEYSADELRTLAGLLGRLVEQR